MTISGIGNTTTRVEHEVCVSSRISSFSMKCSMLILPSITVKISVDTRQRSIPEHVDLADPTFAITSSIDMILGAAHFFRVLRYGRISLGNDLSLLQNTEFGWVVSGECMLENHDHKDPRNCQFSNPCTIDELVNRFWQLEEVLVSEKVAPVDTKSIPRLEICAAHLLAKLLVHAMNSVEIAATVYLWTDSTIVLDWLAATPSSWKTFMANRVAEIQELTTHAVWNHVPSKDNPRSSTDA
nr:uncharacterized protein LOC109398832 [Aedes albopictus]